MKNKVCECFWTICMYCSQNNVLITVISSGSYKSDCVLTTAVNCSVIYISMRYLDINCGICAAVE